MFQHLSIHGIFAVLFCAIAMASSLGMAAITDTTSKTISGKDGTADISLTLVSGDIHLLKCHTDMFRLREGVEMLTADTFCIEGTADQDPGRAQLAFELAGILKKGGPTSAIMFPISQSDIQGAIFKFTISTGCFVTGPFNVTESEMIRLVNQNARWSARGVSKPGYTYTWLRL